MDYPSWAPADLVAWHKEIHGELDDEHKSGLDKLLRPLKLLSELPLSEGFRVTLKRDQLLLDRFIFLDDAKSLWEILFRTERFRRWEGVGSIVFGPAHNYWQICEEALDAWNDDPKLTGSEKEKELQLIAGKARELAGIIERSSYMRYTRMRDIRIAEDAVLPPLSNEDVEDGVFLAPAITKEQEISAIVSGLRKIQQASRAPSDEENAASLLSRYSDMGIGGVLRQIAAIADEENQYSPLVSSPGSAHAKRQFIARYLKDAHMEIFGSPMWGALAIACTLIVDPSNQLAADDTRPYCR